MASPSTRQGSVSLWDRGEVIGAAVLAFAGMAWFGWAQQDPPLSWVPFLVAGSVLSGLLLVVLIALLVRHQTTTTSPLADPRVRRGYWIIVGVELVAIIVGNVVLVATGQAGYQAAWTLFVVGVHFVPLAKVMGTRGLAATGVVTAGVAIAATVVGFTSSLASSAAAGVGGGIVFVAYAGWVVVTGRDRC